MLNSKHLSIAALIDTRARELDLAGANEVEIFMGMQDLMPGFKHLMDTAHATTGGPCRRALAGIPPGGRDIRP